MSDERQAFEQLHAIPSGAEWCEKRHIYIHKKYSGLVLHPINESLEAFCEGALWQASRQALEGEAIGEVGYMIQPNWDDPSKTKSVALVDKSLAPGTKLYTHPASAEVERLQARVAELYDLIKYAQVDSGVCMCGDDIKDHNQYSGHSPVDVWDHAVEQINKEGSSEAFILRKQAEAVQASRQAASVPEGWRSTIEKAINMASVFDDGGDGAKGVVSLLTRLLASPTKADERE